MPAGSGQESGRWTSGDTSAVPVIEGRSIDSGVRVRTAFLDDRRSGDIEERAREKQENTFSTETFEDARAHGHPIPLLPDVPFGLTLPNAGTTTPRRRLAPGTSPGGGGTDPPAGGPQDDDRERLCPKPSQEQGGHSAAQTKSKAYQEFVGRIVNPKEPPVPAGWGYGFFDPQKGKVIYLDHCRFSDGAFIEAKSRCAFLIGKKWNKTDLAEDFIEQARLQLRLAKLYGGRSVE